jgi:protein associated with RNAse G/E
MYEKNIKIGDKLQIQCYKHNGNVHRSWDEAILLDVKKDYMVFGNNKTNVTKAEGITWKTKEPAIMYFFKDKWYNIIAQLKKDGVYYYCNIASPFIIEENTIKYIDYDLDLRVFPSGQYKILDRLEYNYHKKIMNYSDELDKIINSSLNELINDYENKKIMFSKEINNNYYNLYKSIEK